MKKFFYRYPNNGGYGAVRARTKTEARKKIKRADNIKRLPAKTRVWEESRADYERLGGLVDNIRRAHPILWIGLGGSLLYLWTHREV